MSRGGQNSASAAWGRSRLLATLAVGVAAALLFVTGLVLALYYGLKSAEATSPTPSTTSKPPTTGSGPGYRDQAAASPMLKVAPDDARGGVPAAVTGPVIEVPPATGAGPEQVPTGFPRTPEGAVAQLAAIETTVLQAMSIPQANDVHAQWALPDAPDVASWPLTKNVQSFLASAGQGQSKDPTVAVTATPAAGQIKATDGPDWVVACVLLDIRATITAEARIGFGYCERMQWRPEPTRANTAGGRWMIAPGAPAATAPSTWPGTEIAFKAGWRTWAGRDDTGSR
jgi:hypothetical protein